MPVYGTNLKDNSQLLDTRYALLIQNYLIEGVARMRKRGGQTVNFDTGETDVITLSEEYRNGFDIEAYNQKVRAYDNTTGTFTDIKTNFTANNGGWTGDRYGDYFFVNNFVDGLWRISRTLAYNAQTANFTVGKKITGATSGATAYILEDSDAGATGTLTLGNINPNPITGSYFVNGEIITDDNGVPGSATTNGTLSFAITQVTAAPRGKVFKVIGKRAILVNLATDEAGYNYSNADTGGNPPFSNWTTGTGFNDPGTGSSRNGGAATDVELIGADIVFVGQQKGFYAFRITQTVLANVTSKFDDPVQSRKDFPIYRCTSTNIGMIVTTPSGIWKLNSLGQTNVPYSDQWECLTDDMGEDYFKTITFTNSDIAYDPNAGFIYVTCGKNSPTINNLVLAVKANVPGVKETVKAGATSELIGWNIRIFMVSGNTIYGTSALKTIRYKLFTGQKDVNAKIHSEYLQELQISLNQAFNMEEFYANGELSPASNIEVSFDTFAEDGYYRAREARYEWVARFSYPSSGSESSGWGEAGWGEAGWGGGSTSSGLIPTPTGARPKLRMLSRVYLRFSSDDFSEHIINWFSADVTVVRQTRNRQLTKIT